MPNSRKKVTARKIKKQRVETDTIEMDTDKWNKLYDALESSDMNRVKYLIEEERIDPDYDDECMGNILHNLEKGQADFADYLILKGANVKSRNTHMNEERALHYASRLGDAQIVSVLLKHGAEVNCLHGQECARSSLAPLHYAPNVAVAKVLIQHGADVNIVGKLHKTTASDMLYGTDCSDELPWTPLLAALKNGLCDVAKVLIENGGNVVVSSLQNPNLHSSLYSKCK